MDFFRCIVGNGRAAFGTTVQGKMNALVYTGYTELFFKCARKQFADITKAPFGTGAAQDAMFNIIQA
jgi:hypothetical protein